MDFPDHVLFNVNVAVVAMVFRKKYGHEYERADSTTDVSSASNASYTSNASTRSIVTSDEMWTASENLYNTLIQCLETEDSVLNFINWFLDGVRKTEESIENISLEKWDEILKEFASKMRRIYENRKVLKCRTIGQSKENSEVKVKRKSSVSSLTRIKNLLKRPSLKKNKTRSSKLNPSTKVNSLIRINQIPVTVSPLQNKFNQKTVALKRLVDSQDLNSNFVNKYLNQNGVSIDWCQRISILHGIVRGIYELHKANLIHHNLHTGNILLRHNTRKEETGRFNTSIVRTLISDSGLWGPAGSSLSGNDTSGATSLGGNTDLNTTIIGPTREPKISPAQSMINLQKGKLYGILPYIAPEVLQGKQYTQSSDIYSLGIIMWELSNSATLGKYNHHSQPFHDQPHDINLATEIVNGRRPNIDDVASGTIPECWLNLMKNCWASKPEDRPNIEDVKKITSAWNIERSKNSLVLSFSRFGDDDVVRQFIDAEKSRVERLNKGKQVERDNKLEEKDEEESGNELKENVTERLNQEDHNYNPMKSHLLDFLVEVPSPKNHKNLEIIYEDIDSPQKEKVDSGYQQPIEEHEDEVKPEKPIEKERDPNKKFEEKPYVNETQKQVLLGVKQYNQDSPIKNGIEANSEIGSKEFTLTKEKEP
ncbi:17493_t:CDS:2 [Funneliformis geosporum]|nr:17493_t:CDS:2 [Funneliformis geosporum]